MDNLTEQKGLSRIIRIVLLLFLGVSIFFVVGCATSNFYTRYYNYQQCIVEVLMDGRLQGSGWFASQDGEVITAAHVIKQGKVIQIRDYKSRRIPYSIQAVDIGHDLALLKPSVNYTTPNFFKVSQTKPAPFEMIYLAGAALFRHNLILPGWVARAESTFEFSPVFDEYIAVYHVAADTPPGTSGGCWVNKRGQVVGLQSGLMTLSGAGQGVAFVVPPDAISKLLKEKRNQSTSTIQCIIEELWEQPVDVIKKFPESATGVIVVKLIKNGVAEKAGLKNGDLIISINGEKVEKRDDFIRALRKIKKGDIARLSVLSQNEKEPKSIDVVVQSLEEIVKFSD
jgi:S1-C subfamily serine protease